MYKRKSRKTRMEHCGTPELKGTWREYSWLPIEIRSDIFCTSTKQC